jgi:hypothetical protein
MQTLASHAPVSSTDASSLEALVAALHWRVRANVDRSKSALIFKEFLEDQLCLGLLPERSSLDGKPSRNATIGRGDTAAIPSVTIRGRLLKTLGSIIGA